MYLNRKHMDMTQNDLSLKVHIPGSLIKDGEINPSILTSNRKKVFYDENIPVYISLLHSQPVSVDPIEITVQLKIVGSSNTVNDNNDNDGDSKDKRTFVTHRENVTKSNLVFSDSSYAIWKCIIRIDHPRARLIAARVIIDAVMGLGSEASPEEITSHSSSFLEPFKPIQDINVFESLIHYDLSISKSDKGANGRHLSISEPSKKQVGEQITSGSQELLAVVEVSVFPH